MTGSLEQRLAALEDRAEIADLEGRYARTWDSGDAPGWAAVFTEDGVWESVAAEPHAPANVVRGRAALEAFCARCAEHVVGLHFLHLTELAVDGDTARSLVYFDFRGTMQGGGARVETRHQLVTGHYRVDYVRTAEGWRMQRRLEEPVAFATSAYIGGLLQSTR